MAKVMIYSDYEQVAKVGDRIVLGGKGILDGLQHASKSMSHKVVNVAPGHVSLIAYRSKTRVHIQDSYKDQAVAIYSNKEFAQLPLY